jgi:L-malate glycosyltransferase
VGRGGGRLSRASILYVGLGYTTHDRRFLRAFADAGYAVHFCRIAPDLRPLESSSLPAGVQAIALPLDPPSPGQDHDQALAAALASLVQRVRPSLVHAGPVQACGYPAALAGGAPLSVVSWGSDLLVEAQRDVRSAERARVALSRADLVVCDCDAVRRVVQSLADVPDSRIVQLPWGTDLDDFRPTGPRIPLRERPGWRDSTIVLHTRSWEPGYGLDVVLDAFDLARHANPALRLVLAGDGSLAPLVRDTVSARALHEHVLLPGRIPNGELSAWFRTADVYLSASESDGSSVSLLEALATGLACVVTDIDSNAEWVANGENGWRASSGDAHAFATCLQHAASLSESDRDAMRARNRSVAEERADWSRNVRRLIAAYDRIAGRASVDFSSTHAAQ